VVEGKQVDPFVVRLADCRLWARRASDVPGAELQRAMARHRLAYRDVASATNRLTLIAAIIPPGAVTVHTLFCLKTPLSLDDQTFLCALLNSFVANYLVRLWVTTHLGTTTVERLRVPRPADPSWACGRIRERARELLRAGGRHPAAYAEVQALAARLYGLSRDEFSLVLESFPLVERGVKAAASEYYTRLAERPGRV
jgi:hypothetical protein